MQCPRCERHLDPHDTVEAGRPKCGGCGWVEVKTGDEECPYPMCHDGLTLAVSCLSWVTCAVCGGTGRKP